MREPYKERRSALRAAIQMGGAWVIFVQAKEDLCTPVAFSTCAERRVQFFCFQRRIGSPAQRMRDARRRLMLKGKFDGSHGEDRR